MAELARVGVSTKFPVSQSIPADVCCAPVVAPHLLPLQHAQGFYPSYSRFPPRPFDRVVVPPGEESVCLQRGCRPQLIFRFLQLPNAVLAISICNLFCLYNPLVLPFCFVYFFAANGTFLTRGGVEVGLTFDAPAVSLLPPQLPLHLR